MKNTRLFFDLLFAMTEKELRARYKHTVFGFFWLVANPLLQMLVIGFVFTFLLAQPVKNYYFFLFIGLLVSILQLLQQALLGLPGPGPGMLLSNIGVIVIITILGITVFRRESKYFDDWL